MFVKKLLFPLYFILIVAIHDISSQGSTKELYSNPIIHADYSDPDVVRVGDDYYMVSSSFSHIPGLPVLHSKDLVNWTIINHAIQEYPSSEFDKPQHGNAVWAPCIRYHDGYYFIYFGDPDRGVFMTKTTDPAGTWDPLKLIKKVHGWIDCTPLWDDDGKAYLVHAYANSRVGLKSVLMINEMSPNGEEILETSTIIFNKPIEHNTIEGPKMYKRNNYYYIFAPAGGVSTGWQTILRSKNPFGPYEDKIVLEQGGTNINGPHQGAWIDTPSGEDWFIHFQDKSAYGRIVHLQPMSWKNDWPIMGADYDKNGIGEPVSSFRKPSLLYQQPTSPVSTDEFDGTKLGLQWQWQSNYQKDWYDLTSKEGSLRLYSQKINAPNGNLWENGNLLMQKFPALEFSATTLLSLNTEAPDDKAGLIVFGRNYFYLAIQKEGDDYTLSMVQCINAKQDFEKVVETQQISRNSVYLRLDVEHQIEQSEHKALCQFSFSLDNKTFEKIGNPFYASPGVWVGAKMGLFAVNPFITKKNSFLEADWFRVETNSNK